MSNPPTPGGRQEKVQNTQGCHEVFVMSSSQIRFAHHYEVSLHIFHSVIKKNDTVQPHFHSAVHAATRKNGGFDLQHKERALESEDPKQEEALFYPVNIPR